MIILYHLHILRSSRSTLFPYTTLFRSWKEWTAKELDIVWQRDFFEHRLRNDESRREKADYILQNPVRKKLVRSEEHTPELQSPYDVVCRLQIERRSAAPSAPRSAAQRA